ncbi:hypothetical protein BGX33_007893 [Mortierella sp. NVP41]|nr:hypothetical protein BGX33_007893 [Mortierella sp. NVP41]
MAIVPPTDFAYASYITNRSLDDYSAISFFEAQKFTSNRQKYASDAWLKVVALVERHHAKRAKQLLHSWKASSQERKTYWLELEQKEKQTRHLSSLEEQAREQTLDAARKVTHDTRNLVNSIIGDEPRKESKRASESDIVDSPLFKKRASDGHLVDLPFQLVVDEEKDGNDSFDIISLVDSSTTPINKVFDLESFDFQGRLGPFDIGQDFTSYFNKCATLRYSREAIPDFLSLSGVLFLGENPTSMQQQVFGNAYHGLSRELKQSAMTLQEERIDECISDVRSWKDSYNKTLRRTQSAVEARYALQMAVDGAGTSSLKRLFSHGCLNFSTSKFQPVSEADQTSSFILPMLACIMNNPDESRIAHTATTPTTGSLFVRLCKDLGTPPKHPDLIVKHADTTDIGFGEVSFTKDFGKDQGDLCRLAIWTKRALDHLVAKHEGLEDMELVFMQVVGTKCKVFVMRRAGPALPSIHTSSNLMNQSSFSIGLGLTAAAHIYLSNLSWRKTAVYEDHYISHHRPFQYRLLVLTLQDYKTLSDTIKLLDSNILKIDRLLQHPGKPPKTELNVISPKELKTWMEFYTTFRRERTNMIRSVAKEMMRTDDDYIDMRTNQVLTCLLSSAIALRYTFSTGPAARWMNKHLPRLYSFGSWIAQGLGVNSSSSPSSSTQISTLTGSHSAVHDGSWGSLFIQLAPTLFLSGIHFIAGVRCQWVISDIQQDRERELLYVKRLCVVAMFLNLRHSRLEWLLRMGEACEDFQMKREAAGYYEEIDEDEIDEARVPGQKPERPSTHDRLRILAEDPKSQVYSLLHDAHDGLLFEYMANSNNNNNNNNNSNNSNTPTPGSNNRASPFRSKELSFGPDLENMDKALFLGDPRERMRIMRLEYLAMKTELEVFLETFAMPGMK